VAAVAAKQSFGAPVIVVDFGTATTFNAVNRAGEFVGGAIAPGLVLAADALYRSTAQLPRIDLAVPPRVIATNTTEAIQSGIVYGYLGMIEGMVKRMRDELGEPQAPVVGTGGLVQLVGPHTTMIDHVDPHLILQGLRMIFDMNAKG
jgi:type III pantothenate kinase